MLKSDEEVMDKTRQVSVQTRTVKETGMTGTTTTNPVQLQPMKQQDNLKQPSVKTRVLEFTRKFSIPPNPPDTTNHPPPQYKTNVRGELAPVSVNRRRPSQKETGEEYISCEGGRTTTEGNK